MRYYVGQRFETLGDPCQTLHRTRNDAEERAEYLRDGVATMVAARETPLELDRRPTGFSDEIEAWKLALEEAGMEYDDHGNRTDDSPKTYGLEAGKVVADMAVWIVEIAIPY